jgi:hypothetical protein
LTREGHLIAEEGMTYLADADEMADCDSALAPLQAASCARRIALGPRAGRKGLSLQRAVLAARPSTHKRCAPTHMALADFIVPIIAPIEQHRCHTSGSRDLAEKLCHALI